MQSYIQNQSKNMESMEEISAVAEVDAIQDHDRPNPLENVVVLMRFFQLCDKSDLSTLRLVSSLWNDLSLKRFRDQMKVQIGNPEILDETDNQSKGLPWGELEELHVGDGGRPFRSFQLFDLSFGTHETGPDETYNLNMDLFWVKFGQWIHKLELVDTDVFCVQSFKKAIFEQTPNLQELKLELNCSDISEVDENDTEEGSKMQLNLTSFSTTAGDLPISWPSVFSHFPNIRKFKTLHRDDSDNEGLISLVDTLETTAFQNLRITQLTLDLQNDPDVGDVPQRLLRVPQLQLSSLCLRIKADDDIIVHVTETALLQHGHTLTKLRLFRRRHRRRGGRNQEDIKIGFNLPFHLNTFPCLTELELFGGLCRNFHFLENTPNLKVLKMERCFKKILKETDMTRARNVVMAHLREFHFKSVEITEVAMEMFVKMMPNLERLYACFGVRSLRLAFQHLGNLRDLEIKAGFRYIWEEDDADEDGDDDGEDGDDDDEDGDDDGEDGDDDGEDGGDDGEDEDGDDDGEDGDDADGDEGQVEYYDQPEDFDLPEGEDQSEDENDYQFEINTIEYSKIGDEGITGIETGSEIRHPNITNLKYLHKLELTNVKDISQASILDGFLKLPHLHTLNLTLDEINHADFEVLVEHFEGAGLRATFQANTWRLLE